MYKELFRAWYLASTPEEKEKALKRIHQLEEFDQLGIILLAIDEGKHRELIQELRDRIFSDRIKKLKP